MVRIKEDTKFKIRFRIRRIKVEMKKRSLYILIFIFIFAISAGIYGVLKAFFNSDFFNVKYVQIRGMQNLTPEAVIRRINLFQPVNIFEIDTQKLIKRLSSIGWVESVSITSKLPDTIIVNLRERVPYTYLQVGKRYFLIDRNGVVITGVNRRKFSLPLLRITDLSCLKDGKIKQPLWSNYVSLVEAISSCGLTGKITGIETDGGGFNIYINSLKIDAGTGDFKIKLCRLKKALSYLEKRGISVEELQFLDKDDVVAKYTKVDGR